MVKVRVGVAKTGRDADPYRVNNTFEKADFSDGFTPGYYILSMDYLVLQLIM